MALTITAQSIDGTLSVDLLTDPYNLTWDGIRCGQANLTDIGKLKSQNGERTTDDDYQLRQMGWRQAIAENSAAALKIAYDALNAIISQSRWILILNPGTGDDRYYDCYAVTASPDFTGMMAKRYFYDYEIKFDAMPFARGPAISLPHNWLVDALMSEDNNNDGICNSFVNADSGTPPTHTNYMEDGWQVISVTGGGSTGAYAGISQTFTPPSVDLPDSPLLTAAIEFKTSDSLTNCRVYVSVIIDEVSLELVNQLTPQTTPQRIIMDGSGIYGGSPGSITIKIIGTATGMVGKLYVRKAQAIIYDTSEGPPIGYDGTIPFYCTTLAETPGTMIIDNIPGDVPATAVMKFISHQISLQTQGKHRIYAGIVAVNPNVTYKSFIHNMTTSTDSTCLGGKYGVATSFILDNRPVCNYFLLARTRTTNITVNGSGVNISLDILGFPSHGFVTGDAVTFTTNGTAPAPIVMNGYQTYYVVLYDANNIRVSNTYNDAMAGTYIDITSTGSGTATAAEKTDTVYRWYDQVVNPNLLDWLTGTKIKPYVNTGYINWTIGEYGVYENPLRGISSYRNSSDSYYAIWEGRGTDNVDYEVFMPLEQYFRADIEPPISKYVSLLSDSQDVKNPGFSVSYENTINYQLTGDDYYALSAPRDGAPLMLAPGPQANYMMLLTTVQASGTEYDKKSGGSVIIELTPRYK